MCIAGRLCMFQHTFLLCCASPCIAGVRGVHALAGGSLAVVSDVATFILGVEYVSNYHVV
jgi:hypothetical protein